LTLNPVPHLDLFGSLILPAILLFQQSEIMFGWAKPVPVNPENFKDPKKDHMLVSFAGPAMNLIVAMVCFIILAGIMLFIRLFWPGTLSLNFTTPFSPVSLVGPPFARWLLILIVFLKQFFYTSLALGIFNLIPVPPLDGSWILSGLLPQRFGQIFEKTRRFGFVIFLLFVMTPVLDYIMSIPIGFAWGAFQLLASAMGLG
jgi:Zn-dependent protease